jgi:hypothetical protein
MRRILHGKGHVVLAGEIAVFLKNVSNGNAAEVRDAYKRYNVELASFPKDAWETCFQERMKKWYDWIFMRKGNPSALEKLIASTDLSSSNLSKSAGGVSTKPSAVFVPRALLELTPNTLRSSRGFAAGRPRPATFDFSPKSLNDYFSSLPAGTAAKEKKRSEQIAPLKRHLCAMMFHMPYTGQNIKLRNGKVLRGKVMANPKYLSIRRNSGHERVYWKDLAPSQFAQMLAFFAQTRIDMDKKREGARGYMRAALFCDWYGLYDEAVKYAKLAAKTDPSLTKEITNLLIR